MASQTINESQPKTVYLSEQLQFKPMELEPHGENRVRKQATITGNGPFTELTNDVVITITANQMNKMALLQNAYIVVDITNNNANSIYFQGRGGTLMIIESLTLSNTSGLSLNYFRDYNVLAGIELCKNMDSQYQDCVGSSLFGLSSSDIAGQVITGTTSEDATGGTGAAPATAGTVTKIIPMAGICNLFKLCPLWGVEDLVITLKIANPKNIYRCNAIATASTGPPIVVGRATANIDAGSVVYSNLRFIYETIDIPVEIFKSYLKSMGNQFYLSGSDWYSTNATIAQDTTSTNIPIPVVKNCVKRVLACMRTSANLLSNQKVSICSRNRCTFNECYLTYNSVSYPVTTIKIKTNSISEQLAEVMISSSNHLMNLTSANLDATKYALAEGAANTDATCGLFWYEFNLTNHLQDDNSTYSGLNVSANNLSLNLNGGTTNAVQRIDIFVEYQVDYILDNGIWSVRS